MASKCRYCIYFLPNTPHPAIGLCSFKKTVVYADLEACSDFKEVSLDDLVEIMREEGWVYCVTCGKVITSTEELIEHIKNHQVSAGVVPDESIWEESCPGD